MRGDSTTLDADLARSLHRCMSRIRQFEEAAGKLLADGQIPGFLHLSIGQEAIAAGVCSVLGVEDHITTTHRGHGHCIAKGGSVDRMVAELFGKAEGYCRGRSGSMHIADPAVGILGANAIVGGGLAMALGAALSAQCHGQASVALSFFGDGAVAEGVFHECLNLAALWKLPIIFVCENNGYAEMTPSSVHLSTNRVADFGAPYGIPAATHDGNDVAAVRAATITAVERARAGEGPSLLEFTTYRWRGHFEGDAQRYRRPEELAAWKERDPLKRLRSRMVEELSIEGHELDAIEQEIAQEIARAVTWARELPDSGPELLTEDVYHTGASLSERRPVHA